MYILLLIYFWYLPPKTHLLLNLDGFDKLHALSIKSQKWIPRLIFVAMPPSSSLVQAPAEIILLLVLKNKEQ